jgi:hypothetical protein
MIGDIIEIERAKHSTDGNGAYKAALDGRLAGAVP